MSEAKPLRTPDAESALEVYKVVRAQIVDESTLVGVRLGWLIGAEAFLVAAYATVLTVGSGAAANFVSQSERLYSALPVAGFVLSLLMGVSIWSALVSMERLRKGYVRSHQMDNVRSGFEGAPNITVRTWLYLGGSTAPMLVPLVTMAGWAWVYFAGR